MARHDGHKVSKLALFGAAAPAFTIRLDFPYGKTVEEVNKLHRRYLCRPTKYAAWVWQYFLRPFPDN